MRHLLVKDSFSTYYAKLILPLKSFDLIECNLCKKDMPNIGGSIWVDVWRSWCQFRYQDCIKLKDVDIDNLVNQPIWLNTNIRNAKGVLFNSTLYGKGLLYLKDLINVETSEWYSINQLVEKYDHVKFLDFCDIMKAIPTSWKKAVTQYLPEEHIVTWQVNPETDFNSKCIYTQKFW